MVATIENFRENKNKIQLLIQKYKINKYVKGFSLRTYTHTYIHTYIHYIHTYIHSYIHTYIHTVAIVIVIII